MGSILIRKVPDGVHRKFKQACRARKVSMEEAIVRLLAREVGEGRRGRPRTSGAKRRTAVAKRGARKGARKTPKKSRRRASPKAKRRASKAKA
jgi:hypothetical protein